MRAGLTMADRPKPTQRGWIGLCKRRARELKEGA